LKMQGFSRGRRVK